MTAPTELQEPGAATWVITHAQDLPFAVELADGVVRIEPHEGGLTKITITDEGVGVWAGLNPDSAKQVAAWLIAYAARPTAPATGEGSE